MPSLDLSGDVAALTAALVDTPSVSGAETALADAVEATLSVRPHLRVDRDGDTVIARTGLGRAQRVLLAGHLDTVPIADNLPSRRDGDRLYGCGSSDMKSGDAVLLRTAATLTEPAYDLTFVCYDNEEVGSALNGLGRVARSHPDWLAADLAILLEPTNGDVEAGCQGTLRATVRTTGQRAHSARSWLGENAIHRAAPVLDRLARYAAREVEIEGCRFREGLNAVGIDGGVAGNIIPDECVVTVNFRFAPDRDEVAASAHVREVFGGYDVDVVDVAPGALPGLDSPLAQAFLRTVDRPVNAKLGWTDVSRFAAIGVPALNFGPGDPDLAHKPEEHAMIPEIERSERVLAGFLRGVQ